MQDTLQIQHVVHVVAEYEAPSTSPTASPLTVFPSATYSTSSSPFISIPCQDFPPKWHDSESSKFDCDWYSEKLNCSFNGNDFQNDGKTANISCCTCDR